MMGLYAIATATMGTRLTYTTNRLVKKITGDSDGESAHSLIPRQIRSEIHHFGADAYAKEIPRFVRFEHWWHFA